MHQSINKGMIGGNGSVWLELGNWQKSKNHVRVCTIKAPDPPILEVQSAATSCLVRHENNAVEG